MNNGNKPVGILAVQGDFEKHAQMLERIGAPWKLVKHVGDLADLGGLIMPGGESTTMLKFLSGGRGEAAPRPMTRATQRVATTLREAIEQFAEQGKPVFGTCAGAILLAKDVSHPAQESLALIDISIERNAYGRQIDSSVRRGDCPELSAAPVEMVFIRAPIIRRLGEGVRVLGTCDGLPVLVGQGNILAATFHPELTQDESIHRYFLSRTRS
jgi:pyridoxal 5'-phosphate synthase pdxT subunit